MEPEVRYLILCDDVLVDPQNLLRLNVLGLITHIRSTAATPFPLVRPLFCILVILTGCQGAGELSYRIVQSGTRRVIFRNQPRPVQFGGNSGDAIGLLFRIRNCTFPSEGLYWVELIFSGIVIARQPLSLTK